jgi:predicted dehydrogenase
MFRVGIIGCGHISRGHAMAARDDDRLEVVAYADVVLQAANNVRDEFGGEYTTDDADRLIADDSLDIIVISTHHDSHAALAIAAAEAGRHILLEKPIATSTLDAQAIARAVDSAGVKLAVNYKFRLEDAVRRAHAAIAHPRLLLAQLAMPPIEGDGPGAWVFDPVRGGGLVMSTGTHLLDLLLFLSGSDPTSVQARSVDFFDRPHGSADVLSGQISFANGSLANIVISDAGEDNVLSRWSCQLYDGPQTAILLDRLGRVVFAESMDADADLDAAPATMLASLADAIATGGEAAANAWDGVAAVRLAESLTEAAVSGSSVGLAPSHAV